MIKKVKFLYPLLGVIGLIYFKIVLWTGRWAYQIDAESDILNHSEKKALYVFWHSRLFMIAAAKPKNNPFYVMVSRNYVGDILEYFTKFLNIYLIRGSSINPKKPLQNKGSLTALRQVMDLLHHNQKIAITPDGPKGPRHILKTGVIILSKTAQCPIIPVSFSCDLGVHFNSWDRFLLPLPFSKGIIYVGKPIFLNDDMSDDAVEQDRQYIQNDLNNITHILDKNMGRTIK